jgi:hypothetical protein
MKKTPPQRLTLNRQTISRLSESKLDKVGGMMRTTDPTTETTGTIRTPCPSCNVGLGCTARC